MLQLTGGPPLKEPSEKVQQQGEYSAQYQHGCQGKEEHKVFFPDHYITGNSPQTEAAEQQNQKTGEN